MTAICKLRFSYLGLLRLLPNRFNGPVLAENGVMGNLICLPNYLGITWGRRNVPCLDARFCSPVNFPTGIRFVCPSSSYLLVAGVAKHGRANAGGQSKRCVLRGGSSRSPGRACTIAVLQFHFLVQDERLHGFALDTVRGHGFYRRLRLHGLL